MSVVYCNYLVRASLPTFAENTPNPGTADIHGAQYVRLVDANGVPLAGGLSNGGAVTPLTLASGVTTNTTSATVAGMTGNKTFWAEVVGTGSLTATVTVYGCRTSTAANGVLLATLTLSGTTQAQDAAATSTASYPYYYVTTASVTGTGATVRVEVFY